MENLANIEDWMLVGKAMLKIAINFWPCILVLAGYAVYEVRTLRSND